MSSSTDDSPGCLEVSFESFLKLNHHRGPNIFFSHFFSWVLIRLHTKNQLPRLSGSALKVPGGGWVPTHY